MEVSGWFHVVTASSLVKIPGPHWKGCYLGSKPGLDFLERRKYRASVGIRTPNHPARSVMVISTGPHGVQVSVLDTKFVFLYDVVKVKCTFVQTLRFCTGRTAHRRSWGIALLFLDNGTRRGWGVSVTPRPLFILEKDPVPIVQEAFDCTLHWGSVQAVRPIGGVEV